MAAGWPGHYETLSRSYIDSEALLWEMKETADFLASGLISSSPLGRVFYNPGPQAFALLLDA